MNRLLLLFLISSPVLLKAQRFEAGLFSGFANYQGDLSEPPIEIGETSLSFGGFVRFNASPKFRVRASTIYGLISGSDVNSSDSRMLRGWSFETNLIEVGLQGEFHPLGKDSYATGGVFKANISPYFASGLGFVNIDAKVTVPDNDKDKFPEPDAKTTTLSVPFIVGVRFDAYEHFTLGLEWGWRATFNDYLDGVSKNGNENRNDWYLFIGGSAAYIF
ncbi:MAG: hypothetical protein HY842_05610 [Bacteroidetes bacterium]|nr:hypothetical protein [Bacteroidota bacterium]